MTRHVIPRRALGAGLAAVLGAGAVLLGAAPALAAAQSAQANKPGWVAVVISGQSGHCVKWKSGITGDTVLNEAATVGYRSDGLIVQIDGAPSSGTADSSHFWSYWHDKSGKKWSFSNYGASAYQPAAGSVEGWSYDNGKASAPSPSQNPVGLYAKTCGYLDKKSGTVVVPASSAPASTGTTRATATANPTRGRSSRGHGSTPTRTSTPTATGSSTVGSSTSTPSATASSPTASSTATHTRASRPSSAAASPKASSALPSASPPTSHGAANTVDASAAASTSFTPSSGSPVGLFVALGLVVVLGGAAAAVALRRRDAGG